MPSRDDDWEQKAQDMWVAPASSEQLEHKALENHLAQHLSPQALAPKLDPNVLVLPSKLPAQAGSTNL